MDMIVSIPAYTNDPYKDTELFLQEVVGSYIKVDIIDNKPYIELFLNKTMIENNGLSDNARCYTDTSIPSQDREQHIWDMFEDLCKNRQIKDSTLFIGIGDFPIIMKDRSQHPLYDRFIEKYENLYPPKMKIIVSRSIQKDKHDDFIFPSRDFLDSIYTMNSNMKNINFDFKNKKSIAIFRGSITGNDRTISNQRVQAKILSLKYPSILDVELIKTFKYYMFEPYVGCVHTLIDDPIIYNPDQDSIKFMSSFDQYKQNKYILHIDGFVSAWRLVYELFSMCVILKVDSPWIEHYYDQLVPWVHYIPIKSDLSNLIQTIIWCLSHDDICYTIAKNAYNYAVNNFTKDNLFNYVESLLDGCPKLDLDKTEYIDITKNKLLESEYESYSIPEENFIDLNIDKIKYLRYMLPTKRLELDIINENMDKFMDIELIHRISPKNKSLQKILYKNFYLNEHFKEFTISHESYFSKKTILYRFEKEYIDGCSHEIFYKFKYLKEYKNNDILVPLTDKNIMNDFFGDFISDISINSNEFQYSIIIKDKNNTITFNKDKKIEINESIVYIQMKPKSIVDVDKDIKIYLTVYFLRESQKNKILSFPVISL
jgi:hypothetical protein